MPELPQSTISRRNVRIDSEEYLIRTIEVDDASDRWASWMSNPEAMHMLNLPARSWQKADVINYIKWTQKRPARFPARAHLVSFNFTNSLICGFVSSANHHTQQAALCPSIAGCSSCDS
jgi:hypothetical protein